MTFDDFLHYWAITFNLLDIRGYWFMRRSLRNKWRHCRRQGESQVRKSEFLKVFDKMLESVNIVSCQRLSSLFWNSSLNSKKKHTNYLKQWQSPQFRPSWSVFYKHTFLNIYWSSSTLRDIICEKPKQLNFPFIETEEISWSVQST